MALPQVGVEAVVAGLSNFKSGVKGIQTGFHDADAAASKFALSSEKLSAKTIALGNALYDIAKGALNAFGNAVKGALSEGLEATAKYERLQLSLTSLVARELAQGEEVETQRQVLASLTGKEAKELEGLNDKLHAAVLSRDNLSARIQEQKQKVIQLTAAWGEDGLNVQVAKTKLAEMELQLSQSTGKIDEMTNRMEELKAKNGQLVTVIDKVRVGQMSMTDAMAEAGPRAKELLGWIEQLAVKSPFNQDDIANAFKTALAYGFTTEEAQKLTIATTDFLAATGQSSETANRVALALGQIQAKGKLAGQEILQLVNAGVNVNGILGEMGFTLDDVSEGLVSSDLFMQGLLDSFAVFEGAAEAQANTFSGLIASLEDLKEIGLREFFTETFEAIRPLLIEFVDFLSDERGKEVIRETGHILGTVVLGAVQKIQEIIQGFQTGGVGGIFAALGITPEIVELGQKIGNMFSKVGDTISGFISSISGAFPSGGPLDILNNTIIFLNQNFDKFEGALLAVGAVLGGEILLGAIVTLGGALVGLIASINPLILVVAALGAAWNTNFLGIRDVLTEVWEGTILPIFENQILPLLQRVGDYITANLPIWQQTFSTVWTAIQELLLGIWDSLQLAWGAFTALFSGDLEGWLTGVQGTFTTYFTAIADFIGTLWDLVSPYVTIFYENFLNWVNTTDWAALGQGIINYISLKLGEFWTNVEPVLLSFYQAISTWFTETDWAALGQMLLTGITNLLLTGWGMLQPVLQGWYDSASTWFTETDWAGLGQTVIDFIVIKLGEFWSNIEPILLGWYTSISTWFIETDWALLGQTFLNKINEVLLTGWALIQPTIQGWYDSALAFFTETDWGLLGQTMIDFLNIKFQELWLLTQPSFQLWYDNMLIWFQTIDWQNLGVTASNNIDQGFFQLRLNTVVTLTEWFTSFGETVNSFDWENIGYNAGSLVATGLGAIYIFVTETIPNFFTASSEAIETFDWSTLGTTIVDFIQQGLIPFITETLPNWFSDIWGWFTEQTWEDLGTTVTDGFIAGIEGAYSSVQTAVEDFIGGFVEGFKDRLKAKSPSQVFVDIGKDTITGFIEGIEAKKKDTIDKLGKLAKEGVDEVASFNEDFIEVGKDMMKGLIKGIEEKKESFAQTLFNVAKRGWQKLKEFFGISSPSKLMWDVGVFIADGLILGMQSKFPEIESTFEKIAKASQIFSGGSFSSILQGQVSELSAAVKESQKGVTSLVKSMEKLQKVENRTAEQEAELVSLTEAYNAAQARTTALNEELAAKEGPLNRFKDAKDLNTSLQDQVKLIEQLRDAGYDVKDVFKDIALGATATPESLVGIQAKFLEDLNKKLDAQVQNLFEYGDMLDRFENERKPLSEVMSIPTLSGDAAGFAKLFQGKYLDPLYELVRDYDEDFAFFKDQLLSASPSDGFLGEYYSNLFTNNQNGRLAILEQIAQQEERIYKIQKLQSQLDFLDQQQKLLDLIAEHELSAEGILQGLALGIDADSGQLLDAMGRALEAIVNKTNEELQIASPSKVFMKVGQNIGAGLEAGLVSSMQGAENYLGTQLGLMMNAPLSGNNGYLGGGDTISTTNHFDMGNNTINNGMDASEFDARVLDTIRRNLN